MTDAELIARLRKADEYEPLGHDGWEAADRIEALLLAQAALIEARDMMGRFWSEQKTRAEAAEAALQRIADSQPRPRRDGNYEAHDLSALQRIARAHLTKHGSQK